MQLSRQEVAKVALLARLEFSDSELDQFSQKLSKIVTFVEQLNSVSTEGIEPLGHPLEVHDVLRSDQHHASLAREAALANAPSHDHECFLVPPVMTSRRS